MRTKPAINNKIKLDTEEKTKKNNILCVLQQVKVV